MSGDGRDGIDQVSGAACRELLELFDRNWLTRGSGPQPEPNVKPLPRHNARARR